MALVRMGERVLTVPVGTCLSALLSGMEHPCGGKGICGKCKVRAEGKLSPPTTEEMRHLTPFELADGIRLACMTTVEGDCRLWPPASVTAPICAETEPLSTTGGEGYGIAVDVGTTTLAAVLVASGEVLATATALNPQSAYGADVVTRVQAALEGQGDALSTALSGAISHLISDLLTAVGLPADALSRVVIAGNTVMLTLLTGGDVSAFATAPFAVGELFGRILSADSLNLSLCPQTEVYLTPCVSAFVGGDAVCAALSVGFSDAAETALLVDVGTNGEMLLSHDGRLYACSTAAGPAFEGVGISCGLTAREGAIHRVELAGDRLMPQVIGGGTALGVCGSGLVDAVACLLQTGDLERDGHLPYAAPLTPQLCLTPEDVRSVQVSKSAIRSGLSALLNAAGITEDEVQTLYVAGGFGRYLNLTSAATIGLLPPSLVSRTRVVGNAALSGAAILLDAARWEEACRLADAVQVVELATDPYFAQQFIENMSF